VGIFFQDRPRKYVHVGAAELAFLARYAPERISPRSRLDAVPEHFSGFEIPEASIKSSVKIGKKLRNYVSIFSLDFIFIESGNGASAEYFLFENPAQIGFFKKIAEKTGAFVGLGISQSDWSGGGL
jgi:hypothetical protein